MRHRDHRCPCDMPVVVTLPDGRQQGCVIVNISAMGARLARLGPVVAGQRMQVQMGVGMAPREAEVRWARGAFAGVQFNDPLDGREMALARKSVSHHASVKPKGWNLELREMR